MIRLLSKYRGLKTKTLHTNLRVGIMNLYRCAKKAKEGCLTCVADSYFVRTSKVLIVVILLSFLASPVFAAYSDDFSTDTRDQYTVTNTWTQGGTGQFLYDSAGGRLRLLAGDDIGLEFSKALTPLEFGVFSIDFLPMVKYP